MNSFHSESLILFIHCLSQLLFELFWDTLISLFPSEFLDFSLLVFGQQQDPFVVLFIFQIEVIITLIIKAENLVHFFSVFLVHFFLLFQSVQKVIFQHWQVRKQRVNQSVELLVVLGWQKFNQLVVHLHRQWSWFRVVLNLNLQNVLHHFIRATVTLQERTGFLTVARKHLLDADDHLFGQLLLWD